MGVHVQKPRLLEELVRRERGALRRRTTAEPTRDRGRRCACVHRSPACGTSSRRGFAPDGPARAAARAAQDGDGLGQDLYRLTLARGLDDRALDS